MISQRLFLAIFLSSILLLGNAKVESEIMQWNHKIRKQINKNEGITFRSPSLIQSDLNNTININARFDKGWMNNLSYLRIRVFIQFDFRQKVILICDEVGNKQFGRCSIQLKNVKSIQQVKELKLEIISSVKSQIQVQIYLGREYRVGFGEQVILQNEQQVSDREGDWQLLQIEVPREIGQFSQIEFSLTQITGYPSSLFSQLSMTISIAPFIQQIYKQQPLTTKQLSSSSGVIQYALSTSQVHPGDYILINITILDRRKKYKFHSRISIKDQQLNTIVKIATLDTYYQLQLGESDQFFIRYENVFEPINAGEQIEIVIYHFQNTLDEVEIFTSAQRTQQNTLKLNPSQIKPPLSSPHSALHIPLTQQNLLKLQSPTQNQTKHLNIKLSSQSPTSFYICLRITKNLQIIQKQWPVVVKLQSFPIKLNQAISNHSVTKHLNAQRFLFQDVIFIDSKSVSILERQKYFIQVDNSIEYSSNTNTQNSLILLVNLCSFLEFQSIIECLQRTYQQQLQNNQIIVRAQKSQSQKHKTIFSFEYQLSQCPIMTYTKQFSVHKCYFTLFFYTLSSSAQMKPFTFILHKQPSLLPLTSQSHQLTSHYTLAAKSQAFFDISNFSTNTTRATVHLTTYFGDCIVFGSGEEKYPQYDLIEERSYNIGIGGFLQIDKRSSSLYFVSVHCYEQSGFDLHAVTYSDVQQYRRFEKSITLREGFGEQFSLRGSDRVEFVFENSEQIEREFRVEIDQLQGGIQYQIHQQQIRQYQIPHVDNDTTKITRVTCPQQESRKKTCRIRLPSQCKGYVSVWSRSAQIAKFIIILLSQASECHYYPSGRPQYILLQPQQKVCTKFRVTRYEDVQVSLSALSEKELLTGKVEMLVLFNNEPPQQVQVDNWMRFFSKQRVRQLCQSQNRYGFSFQSHYVIDCEIRIQIRSLDPSFNQSLIQMIEFVSSQTQLINHIHHRSIIDSLSQHYCKKIYYYLQYQQVLQNQQQLAQKQDSQFNILQGSKVKVEFSSYNDKDLVIVVRIQNSYRFQIQPDDYYPVYPFIDNTKQYVVKLTDGIRFGEIEIPKQKINCPLTHNLQLLSDSKLSYKNSNTKLQCVLLISIFGTKLNPQQDQHFIYSIKITQGQQPITYKEVHQSSQSQPMSINTDTSQLSLADIGLAKLMWLIIGLSLIILFLFLFIERLCKLINRNNTNHQNRFKYQLHSPTIIISQANINHNNKNDPLADSYAFYPSPRSSSTDIIKAYEISQDDGIVELQYINNRKRHNIVQPYPQLSTPTLK